MVKANEVEVTPFVLQDFIANDTETSASVSVTKKELKLLAKELGLAYDDEHIVFTKKLINAYMKKR